MTDSPVLVLGDGFIGRAIHRHLQARGQEARLLGRRECDLLDAAAVISAIRHESPAIIVLTSAVVRLKGNDPTTLLQNVSMVENVLSACRGREHLVFLSSIDVYGNQPQSPLTTRSPLAPFDCYGASKAIGERLIAFATRMGALRSAMVLRLTGVFGPGDNGLSTVSKLARACAQGRITLAGGGCTLRDFCYVDDLARLVAECGTQPVSGTFNVARGESVSIKALAETIRAAYNPTCVIEAAEPPSDNRAYDLIFDQTEFRRTFPAFDFTSIHDAIDKIHRRSTQHATYA